MPSTPPPLPPTAPEDQLRWLVDRARIGDLLIEYARCADAKDWDGMAALFTEDGRFTSSFGSFPGREFARYAAPIMEPFAAVQHYSTNHRIDLDGDRASSRSYLQAIHVVDPEDQSRHADASGWYDHDWERIDGDWRIRTLELTIRWSAGLPFEG